MIYYWVSTLNIRLLSINLVQAILLEKHKSDFFGPLKGPQQIQPQLSILFQYGANGHRFELLHSRDELIK